MRFSSIANATTGRYRHYIAAMDGCFEACECLSEAVEYEKITWDHSNGGTIRNALKFRSILRELRPDVLLTYNWGAIEWVLANRFGRTCPHVHVEDGFGPEEAQKQLLRRVLARRLLLRGVSAVVVGATTTHDIALHTWKIPTKIVRNIPNGICCDKFIVSASTRERLERSLAEGVPVVGTVGRLGPEKNHGRLIRAFARLLQCGIKAKLVIAGTGPEHGRLQALVEKEGIGGSVEFPGFVEPLEHALATFDVFALSSDTEQSPTTVLEAMAAGLPVASVDVGDVRQQVGPANRPFIVDRDDLALSKAIQGLLQDRTLAREIGSENQTQVRNRFDINQMVAAYEELFQLRDGRSLASRSTRLTGS